ncbi:TetR/AcrR family transcriptional regulator [Vitiosangium sp. GDMCC 1.1324]|uniref:TetR/AcrR family transcriptional regulator n=1 Tax=Vitiosangium sp. (strain GDMCC 1.1324) TaxID=2138576 RepID=UPI000D3763F6|nr:TetR/AcrR family transcriptional regulator [Vitiosangium sp. GDMCC 1.1324]PTL74948.1 TetR family transcriptional regulator [Vitiosangium sp. GDMCC 1.1324]
MTKREESTQEGALRADAARNRERVLAVARELLAGGDASLQMNQIARAAGVGVGTVYRHFPTRQDLLEELVNEHVQALLEHARVAETSGEPGPGLRRFLGAALELLLADVGLAEVLNAPRDANTRTARLKAELYAATTRLLEQARGAGSVRAGIGVDDLQRLMCGIEHAVRIAGGDRRELAERYLNILLDGLRPPPPSRARGGRGR